MLYAVLCSLALAVPQGTPDTVGPPAPQVVSRQSSCGPVAHFVNQHRPLRRLGKVVLLAPARAASAAAHVRPVRRLGRAVLRPLARLRFSPGRMHWRGRGC